MFYAYSHQFNLSGRRSGQVDCQELSIHSFNAIRTGRSPFSVNWALGNKPVRTHLKFIAHIDKQEL